MLLLALVICLLRSPRVHRTLGGRQHNTITAKPIRKEVVGRMPTSSELSTVSGPSSPSTTRTNDVEMPAQPMHPMGA